MEQAMVDFLTKNRVCALTTLLPDGSPHAAALHYSFKQTPFELYFSTENTSKKCEGLLNGETVKASAVVGISEEEWITLQMDGTATLIKSTDDLAAIQTMHYAKHPNSEKFKDDPATVFLKFTPVWWRYTDYTSKPPTILTSEKA